MAARQNTRWTGIWAGLLAALLAGSALAHDGHAHPEKAPDKAGIAAPPAATPDAADFAGRIGGDFDLIDHNGARRTLADFAGKHVLLFFGYANCEAICSAAMPVMADAIDKLGAEHAPVELVMITVDPDRDSPEGLRQGLAKYDPRFVGLTGPRPALERAWSAFSINIKEVARDWNNKPIFAHGSFVYLLGRDGKVVSLLPPILSAEQMAAIIRPYL